MKHFSSLRTTMVLLVLFIMLLSSLLSGIVMVVLYRLGFEPLLRSPVFMPVIALLVSILIGTLLSVILSNRILKPMKELIAATKKVAKGDFSVRLRERGTDTDLDKLITSFNAMTEELAGTEMFKKDFINTFSHEFRTPIVSIRGFAKQLQNENLGAEERKEYIDIIISESERMSNMAGNILLLTKLENQQFIADKAEFLLDEQLRDCILLLENQWQKKEIDWRLDLEELRYFGNEELLEQLWLNLLGNAIKYSREHGVIEVRCHLAPEKVKVTIADQGTGIDAGQIERIFDKFYQADSSHSAEGNGLGLSIVRRIVEMHGGHITVESAVERGTAFYIDLPLEKQE